MSEATIFAAALDRTDTAERAAYLVEACAGDDRLRRRVEALLKAHAEPDEFLDAPSPRKGTIDEPRITERPGTMIGPYKLKEQIGEGGFGLVFVAEQQEPVKRKVALKVIKPGMDTREVMARFTAERQALALMDHPNIARVLDAGATDSGRPYFVMELVRGIPITEYCDQNQLSPRDRLDLFVTVCQAVQHAHQKGIIHRDIKPSNVLVTSHDGKPVAKVIDFGVAKAIHQQLTDRSIYTQFTQMIGTPLYMSPEQAEMSGLDIDTRSDIYSLGVLLYELLTGTTPLEKNKFAKAAYDEIRRMIREEEPPKPSTRLSTSDSIVSIAAQRHTEPTKLSKLIRGDLDWITMKALEKDRTRRYETANGLARDIQRYLCDEPVEACPPSASYRLRKFAKKNRVALTTSAVVAVLLLLGIAASTWQAVRATHAERAAQNAAAEAVAAQRAEAERADGERRAKQEALDAKAKAEKAEHEALKAKAKAEKAEAETLASYRASTDDAIQQLIGSKPDLGSHERTYLENTAKRWQAFAGRKGDDERARAIRGEGHSRIGSVWTKLGRPSEARGEYEQALAIREKLAAEFPAVPAYRRDLARSHNNLGLVLRELGKRPEAEEHFRQAFVLYEKLAAEFPAAPEYRQELAGSHNNLGLLLSDLGKRPEAEEHYRQALAIHEKLAAEFPAVPAYRHELARSHNGLGLVLRELGKRPEAEEHYRQALAIHEKLAAEFPAVPAYRQELAGSHVNLGNLLRDLGKRSEVEEQYRQALAIYERLAAEFPAVPDYRLDLARSHNNLGLLLNDLGKRPEAEEHYRQALALYGKLAAEFPAVPEYQVGLGGNYCNMGILIRDGGRLDECLAWFEKAIRTLTAVYKQDLRLENARQFLRNCHWNRAKAYDSLHKYAEAAQDWDRAVDLSPKDEQPRARANRATSWLNAGRTAEAVAEVAELTTAGAHATELALWNARQWYNFACVYSVASGKIADKKQEFADRAMELLHKAAQAGYKNAAHMKEDTDLDPLREREDFKKLIGELEKKPEPVSKP